MANNIKGITIEIGGNTAPLDKALKDVNKTSRDLQSELREVNKQLKLDPTNTTLLTQKQQLLAESVTNTKGKLETLKTAEKQAQEQFKEGKISEEQYRALQREVIKTTNNLKSLEKEASKSNVTLSKISTSAGKVGEVAGNISNKMMPVTLAIAGAGVAAVKMGSDYNESLNKVEVAFKSNSKEVEAWSKTTLDKFGIASGTALDMAALFGDMSTSMGLSTGKAADMSTKLVGLAGDLASFKNIGIDEASTALKSIFTGETESLKELGIVMTQQNLQEYAASQGIKKKIQDMTQQEQVQLRYNYVLKQTQNAQGDFARTSDGTANSTRVFTESVKELAQDFGQQLLPIITPIIQKAAELIKQFSGLGDHTKKIILIVLALIAAIAPVAGLISTIAMVIGFLASPIGIVVLAIGLLVTAFLYLWTHCEGFRKFWINLGESIKNVASHIGETVKNGFNSAINFIKSLPSQALTWGKDMIDGLIKGITSKISDVGNAVKGIADKIRNYLHFSVPDEGPLADYESWMPDFMTGLAKGIENSKNIVTNSVKGLASDINLRMNLNPDTNNNGSNSNGSIINQNNNGFTVSIENFVNNRSQDVQSFAEELEFYRNQKSLGLGGA